jgi:hypothetical protein
MDRSKRYEILRPSVTEIKHDLKGKKKRKEKAKL